MVAFVVSAVPGVCGKPSCGLHPSRRFGCRPAPGRFGTCPWPYPSTRCHPAAPSDSVLEQGRLVAATAKAPPGMNGEGNKSVGIARVGHALNLAEKAAIALCSSFVELIGAVGPVRSADSNPVFESSLATSPGKPPVVVECASEVRAVYDALYEVTRTPAVLPMKELIVKTGSTPDQQKRYADTRYGAVGIVAGSGSGKTYLLEQVASQARGASAYEAHEATMVTFCQSLRPYVVNVNLHWKLRIEEAALVTSDEVTFSFDGLVNLRLLFMHYADLTASHLDSHFTRFVSAVDEVVRSKQLSAKDLHYEAVALLQTGIGAEGGEVVPVVLVDEVGRADDMKEEASRILLDFIMKKPELYTVNDQLHSPATLLLSGACNISQGAGGHVITTFLSSSLSAKCATLSGRRITPVGGLFSRDALSFQDLFIDVLLRVAWSNKYYVAMDGAQSGSRDALQAFLGARAELEGSGSEQEKMAAFEAMRTALTPTANGMCYCAGGHTRTAVVLHNELMGAGAARRPAPLLAVINSASSKLLLSEAEICWMAAADDDRDNFLAALTFGERVSRWQVCFPERRDPSTGMILSNKVLYDEARLKGLVVGGGERFQPVVPSVALFLLMEHAQSSRFYPILRAELGLGAEEPDTFSITRQVPWMRWEDFFMRYQAAQSVARSLRKELFKAVPLSTLLAPGGSIHMGDGPLLHTVLVDGSTARTQVLQRDLVAILSARGRGVGQERAKTIYQLPFGTMGADAVVFYRTVGPKGEWIMVIQQFKHSKADASTRLSPANIIADWEKLPKEDMMGRKLFKAWKGRIVYFNASNREHEGFPSELLSKDKDVSGLCSQHSVVVSRTNMAAALGPTFFNYINAMDWIHCGSLQPY